ncbi:MAG: DUF374 domain-containing protein [Candidatus Sumerlaeales bacterium]|nr:DUF374 domain-containing protein [Candidatus Sumerlaeales bacterium]
MKLKKKLRNLMHPITLHVLVPVITLILRLLFFSWRKTKRFGKAANIAPILVALPHCEILIGASEIRKSENVVVLQSASKDGQLMIKMVHLLGGSSVIGSTNKNPVQAMFNVLEKLKEKAKVIICFDGPRGPALEMTAGIVYASAVTQVPIGLLVSKAENAWRIKSWDKTKIPKPFSKVEIFADTVFDPPKNTDPEEIERVRLLIQERINVLYKDKE